MIKSQTGSATILAIIIMLFLIILGVGLLPWVTSETRFTTMNKDLLEAEYAAEAGAKRALIEFDKINLSQTPNLGWLSSDQPFISDLTKKYNVTIYLASDSNRTPVASITNNNIYTIESTGVIGTAQKTVTVSVSVTGGGGNSNSVFSKYATYSKGNITTWGSGATIRGDVGTTGNTVSIGGTEDYISGTVYTKNAPTGYYPKGEAGWYEQVEEDTIGTLEVKIPEMPTVTLSNPTTLPTNAGGQLWNQTSTLSNNAYSINSSYTLSGTSRLTVNNSKPITMVINGNLNLTNSSSIVANTDVTIYVDGNVTLDNHSFIQATNHQLNIYATGTVHLTNYATIDSNHLTIQTTSTNSPAVELNSNSSINANSSTAISKIYSTGSVNLTNTSKIGGAASMVVTDSYVSLTNNVDAQNTVFIANAPDKKSNLSNNVKLAGIYTNGSLNMDNSFSIIYKASVMENLGLAGGGGSPQSTAVVAGSWETH